MYGGLGPGQQPLSDMHFFSVSEWLSGFCMAASAPTALHMVATVHFLSMAIPQTTCSNCLPATLFVSERCPLTFIRSCCAATNMWRPVQPAVVGRKEAPPALWGHAIAASTSKIWVAGGRSGRKLQRKTFCLNTGAAAGDSVVSENAAQSFMAIMTWQSWPLATCVT